MWGYIGLLLLGVVVGIKADCDDTIVVQYTPNTYGNDIVNGLYNKTGARTCNNRDTFVMASPVPDSIHLYHIQNLIRGYWIFRDTLDCANDDINLGHVRADDLEFNPGLIQAGWEQELSDGNWDREGAIDVDCVVVAADNAAILDKKADLMQAQIAMGAGRPDVTLTFLVVLASFASLF